jgi:hypothetical protein
MCLVALWAIQYRASTIPDILCGICGQRRNDDSDGGAMVQGMQWNPTATCIPGLVALK